MAGRIQPGDKLPFFRYDTPYSAQNSFRALLEAQAPLVLVFMNNFGHPVTRTFAMRYAATFDQLFDGGFALVVRSRADKLARTIRPDTLPYPLLCDAAGVLYDHLAIPQRSGALTTYSLEALQILHAAKKRGYHPPRDAAQQLPLTLILDADGTVLFCHYGASLTDVPADCAACQALLEELGLLPRRTQSLLPDEDAAADETGDSDVTIYAGRGTPAIPDLDRPVQEYGVPDLDRTMVTGLFDDPYQQD